MRIRVLALVFGLGACGRAAETGDTAASNSGQVSEAEVHGVAGLRDCPASGVWSQCAVVKRLESAGQIVREDSTALDPTLESPRAALLRVGNAILEVYIYPDSKARERAAATLDTAEYLAYTTPMTVREKATAIATANLLGILHTRNDHLRERVGDALTAGPPQ